MTKYIFALLLLLAGAAYWLDLLPFARRTDNSAASLPSAAATRADINPVLRLSGEVAPAFQVDIKPETGGKVKTIHVSAGQKVKKGDPLVTIDDTDLRIERSGTDADIEGSQLLLDKMRGNFERAKRLYDRRLLSREEFVNLESDHKIAENNLERSLRRRQLVDDRISKTRILSPADGTILDVLISEGQVVVAAASVNSGTSLMTFADLSQLLINTHVNQLDLPKIQLGQEVDISSTHTGSDPVKAIISFVAPLATVKNNIKGFALTARINGNTHALKPGVSVSMSVPLGKAENVIAVPLTAVFDDKGKKVVYVKNGGKPERRIVEVGLSDSSLVEITSGLAEGEEVFTVEPLMVADASSAKP